jgi:predicted hotdog family 3-hydroxylacyl-ACP dehydratase
MIASDFDILELIPQRPPMTMIDALIAAEERSARGRLFILATNLFSENGVLTEPGLVEFIAQTAAAYTGYKHKTTNREVSEGYIGAIKNLAIYELPKINSHIESEIVVENEIVGYTIIAGKIYQDGLLLAECEMRILGK